MKDFSDNEQELDDFTIIIKDIKQKLSKEDIRMMFKDCGDIRKIALIKKENKFSDAKIIFDEKDSVFKVGWLIYVFNPFIILGNQEK
jgi:hypothetical protein